MYTVRCKRGFGLSRRLRGDVMEIKVKKDITGQRFDHLVAIKPIDRNSHGNTIWMCKCDCGNYHATTVTYLKLGHCKSCGCVRYDKIKEIRTKHGMTRTRIYRIWQNMKNRCRHPNNPRYKDYGARGITYCEEWEKFELFYEWAQKTGYNDKLTIERIDNNKGYSPDNCRWATTEEQQYNKRTTHFLTYKGETKSMAEWSKIKGIKLQTLAARINHMHWDVEKALETPPMHSGKDKVNVSA